MFTAVLFLNPKSGLKNACAFEKVITVPAEDPEGVIVDLAQGEYVVKIEAGAISVFYPINPGFRWLIAVAVGTDIKDNEDQPNLGMLYFEPEPAVYTQAEAEAQAITATQQGISGTWLKFELKQEKKVRFWVSDFDYTDNSGMIKLRIQRQ